MTERPRIVFLGEHAPYLEAYGGVLRTRFIVDALRQVGSLAFVQLARVRPSQAAMERARQEFELWTHVPYRGADRPAFWPRLARNLNPWSMDTDGFYVPEADRELVEPILESADLVWVHGLMIVNALRRWQWPRTILDVDDLWSRFYSAKATTLRGSERVRALWRASLWRRRETLLGQRFADLVVCSEGDREYVRVRARVGARVHVVPNTFNDAGLRVVRTPSATIRFGFIGTLGYEPNRDAVEWFGRQVWPHIQRALPEAEFRVVGARGPELLQRQHLPGTALGYVEDPTEEIGTWTAMVVPLRVGGGTRIKISEGFVRRVPIVSTRLGAFGYEVTDGQELLLADRPDEFARACVRVAREPDLAERLTRQGEALYRGKYSPGAVRGRVIALAQDVLSRAGRT